MTPFHTPKYVMYKNKSDYLPYYIVGLTNGKLLTRYNFDIQPQIPVYFWENYWGTHKIVDDKLYLDKIVLPERYNQTQFSPINGISPSRRIDRFFHYNYRNNPQWTIYRALSDLTYFDLNIYDPYTGGMLIATEDTGNSYPPSYLDVSFVFRFLRVLEIIFKDGVVTKIIDHSEVAEHARKLSETNENRTEGRTEAIQLMENAFTEIYKGYRYAILLDSVGSKTNRFTP